MFDSVGRLTNVLIRSRSSELVRQNSSYIYDTSNRLTGSSTVFDFTVGRPYSNKFTYSTSNGLLTSMTATNTDTLTPTYNGLKLIEDVQIDHNGYQLNKLYSYVDVSDDRITSLPESVTYRHSASKSLVLRYNYGYDKLNRISSVIKGDQNDNLSIDGIFKYDNYGKLIYAKKPNDTISEYTYDATGNITEIKKTKDGTATTKTFEYDTASGWKDRLMKVDGKSLAYSSTAPGLPTTYQNGRTYNLSWSGTAGELTSATVGGTTTSFAYFYGGLRKTKTSGGVTKNYYYDGSRLIAEKWSTGAYLLYHYDESGSIYAITHSTNGSSYSKYYLLKNIQGDVVQILNSTNGIVANYEYDAWGNVISITDANGNVIGGTSTFAGLNPIRYRGYYYDTETRFYYLQSRYYDPANCRFISADNVVSTDHGTTNLNVFAYCGNDPVNRVDNGGHFWESIFDVISLGASIVEVCVNPTDPLNWAGLVGDVVDLVPFVTGVGEATRAIKTTVKVVDKADDVVDTAKTIDKVVDTVQIAKAVDFTDGAADIVKTLDRSSGFTRSTTSAGRKIHKGYKAVDSFPSIGKEYRKINGIRPDYIDFNTKTIYELKPMNPRGARNGVRQLQKYNKALGGGYNLRLELY